MLYYNNGTRDSGAGTRGGGEGCQALPQGNSLTMCPSLSPSPTPSPRICNVMNIIMKADLDINEGDSRPFILC